MNLNQALKIFQLSKSASQESIKEKYRTLVLYYHPDRNKSKDANKIMAEIIEAYKFLRRTPIEQAKIKINSDRNYNPYSDPDLQEWFKRHKQDIFDFNSKTTFTRGKESSRSNSWNFTFD